MSGLEDPMDAVKRIKAAQRAEARRARHLALNDRDEKARLATRKAAQLEVKQGVYINLDEAAEQPTGEWLAKGEVAPFTPKQLPGTVRTVKSVRRVQRLGIAVLYENGRLTDNQFAAAMWYRDMHSNAGLEGRWPAVRFTPETQGSAGLGLSPIAMHEYEAYCRKHYREAQACIDSFYHKFWDAIVIDNLPLTKAAKLAKCRSDRTVLRLAQVADCVASYCQSRKIRLNVTLEKRVSFQSGLGKIE